MADCTRKKNQELNLEKNFNPNDVSVAENAALYTPTADITSVISAASILNISIIGAAPFNHLV